LVASGVVIKFPDCSETHLVAGNRVDW
jgi:hypothetical protein